MNPENLQKICYVAKYIGWMMDDVEPIRVDILTVGERKYQASYFGKRNLRGFKNYSFREFWRLENAYEDFKEYELDGSILPYDNYNMPITVGDVLVIDYTSMDGSVRRDYHIAREGETLQGEPVTNRVIVK